MCCPSHADYHRKVDYRQFLRCVVVVGVTPSCYSGFDECRVRSQKPLSTALPSHCHALPAGFVSAFGNVPLLSQLMLKKRCRDLCNRAKNQLASLWSRELLTALAFCNAVWSGRREDGRERGVLYYPHGIAAASVIDLGTTNKLPDRVSGRYLWTD